MSTHRAIAGVVYLGNDWLMYADPDLAFSQTENVAPALILGSAVNPVSLTMSDGSEVCGTVLLHASGVWSQLARRCALAVLYLDPLSDEGVCLQRLAMGGAVVCSDAALIKRHGVALDTLCEGNATAARVRRWVSDVLGELSASSGEKPRVDARLFELRSLLHQRSEGRADPEALAGRLGLSAEHVRKLFRQQVGMTLSSYLAWARLYQLTASACEAQGKGQSQSVSQLVSAGGFYDASHASRAIRRYFDLLPTEMLTPKAFVDCRIGP